MTKKFNKTYDEVLTQAFLFKSEFELDQSIFEDFSSRFAEPFAENFSELIEIADDIPTSDDDLNTQTELSHQLELKMEECRAHYQKLLLHIDFAWPNDDSKPKIFGSNLYPEARRVPAKFVDLLQEAYRDTNSDEYKSTLINAGFTESNIERIDELANELQGKLNAQHAFIKRTASRTNERTTAFNNVWEVMTQISNAAKLIFKDNPAKYEFYLLYPEGNYSGGGGGGGSTPIAAPSNFRYEFAERMIRWNSVSGATSYKLESSSDNTNWTVLFDGDGTEFYTGEILPEHVYLRIKSRNANGLSSPASLSIVYNLILNGPANLTHVPAMPGFTWNPVANATAYEVQLRDSTATDDDYINIYFGNSTQLYHADQVGTFYVRIRAWNNEGTSAWMLLAYVIAP